MSLRKRYLAVVTDKKTRYRCDVCGKNAVKRISTGIWRCRHCNATYAGGAYSLKTATGDTFNRIISQLSG